MRAGQPDEGTWWHLSWTLDQGNKSPRIMARPMGLKSLLCPAPAWQGDRKEHPIPGLGGQTGCPAPAYSSYNCPPITVARSPMPDTSSSCAASRGRKTRGRGRPAAPEGGEPVPKRRDTDLGLGGKVALVTALLLGQTQEGA